jgi:integrase/recombinase XerD
VPQPVIFLGEDDVLRLIALERNTRNRTLLRLLYLGGLRVSEVRSRRVRDLQPCDDAGQVTVFGKGGKTARCC